MLDWRRLTEGYSWWHGTAARWIRSKRWLFLGTSARLRPRQKALIKSSSPGGWKVGYQHPCRSSVEEAGSFASTQHLQPVSLADLTPGSLKRPRGRMSSSLIPAIEYLPYCSPFLHQSNPPPLVWPHSLAYIIDKEQQQRCAGLWTCHVNASRLMVLYCKAELEALEPFRWADSLYVWLCATSNLYSFIRTSGDKKESFILSLLFTLRLHIERELFIPFKFHSPLSLSGECFPRLSFHPRQALVSLWGYTLHLSSQDQKKNKRKEKNRTDDRTLEKKKIWITRWSWVL